MKKVSALIIGAGSRGSTYAEFAVIHPDRLKIKGVAEPRDEYRNMFVNKHKVHPDYVFKTWSDAAKKEKFADIVIIATQDRLHTEPLVAFAEKGYHILLEKPMASTADECKTIYNAVAGKNICFAVCHVLRYTPFTRKLKEILDSGAIGEIISMQRLEPVGYWHYAHSFTRGNWRNEKESSFMLLAKSCHDIDWIHYIMNRKCTAVSSFGSLKHFRKENKPAGAGDRCTKCKIEKTCPYSAKKIYLGKFNNGCRTWPVDVITTDISEKGIMKAIETGPYGRCVYSCDNDVVDNQVVNMQFEDGATASFVMTAFTAMDGGGRRTTIFGTKGEIIGDDRIIEVRDFLTDKVARYDTMAGGNDASSGHGGGDYALMDSFVGAVAENNPSLILSGAKETLESHLLVFAAEQSRLKNTVVSLK